MKKLIIIAVVAFAAICANAASWSWKVQGTVYQAGTSTAISSGTAYLFDAGVTSQTALLQAFFDNGKDISTLAISGAPAITIGTDGKGAGTSADFNYSDAAAKNFYVAVLSGDDICLVDSKSIAGSDVGTKVISPNSFSTPSKNAATEWTAGGSYGSAGWYTAASTPVTPGGNIPEPTSGLLLVVGGALLALRRKQK